MAKQLNQVNVNLAFTADTKKAKAQLEDLQRNLNNLLQNSNKVSGMPITKEIEQASVAAATLKMHLQEATNVDTGKLDLGKLNDSLKSSGLNASKIRDSLLTLGPAGAQAFAQFAQSVTLAEVPMRRINARLQEFGVSLKNTARWQISSSILHGFMGTVSSAYNYAQDLNESLNNIRIVTGYSVDEMSKFANEANKAAKALSTTTTEYTNASLIFYQQGLSDNEVQKRTDITIKMANAAGQSAQMVSDQLTAVWNNFYDGSKSLEYYADVMTALGAATASSTDEIAGGLEKFAAVADTIGLSYEYAASALATITSNTRQSEEVVGTALKTIFARIQGLNLGETLEDGTTLNKYSEALQKIGISIFESNGEIKKMDNILDEMANKWQTLAKDQQIALAQTVAGVRQYNQLVSLMDNWNAGDSDSMMANLETSYGATGTLQEQADIYAESWEAAKDRVTASAEQIYKALLNDKFFISFNDGFAKFLDLTNDVIKGLGGVKGIMLALGSVFLKVYNNQIATSINNLVYSLKMFGRTGTEEISKFRTSVNKELQDLFKDSATPIGEGIGRAYALQGEAQEKYLSSAKKMTEEQRKIAQILLDQHNHLIQNAVAQGEIAEKAQETADIETRKQNSRIEKKLTADANALYKGKSKAVEEKKTTYKDTHRENLTKELKEYQDLTKQAATFKEVVSKGFATASTDMIKLGKQIPTIKEKIAQLNQVLGSEDQLKEAFGEAGAQAFKDFETAVNNAGDDPQKVDLALRNLINTMEELEATAGDTEGKLRGVITKEGTVNIQKAGTEYGKLVLDLLNAGTATENFEQKLKSIPSSVNSSVQSLVNFGQKLSSLAMGITSIISLSDTWNDTELTFGEKAIQTMTTLGMLIPILTTLIDKDTIATILNKIAKEGSTKATWAQVVANWALQASLGPVLVVVLAIAAALGGLILVTTLLIKAWQKFKANTPEGKLKAIAKESEELKEKLEETKQKAEELKSAFDSYDSVVEKLEDCKKGTEEWRAALNDVNNQVLELLNQYPELATYIDAEGKSGIYRDEETGALKINQNWRKEQEEKTENQILAQTSILQQKKIQEQQIKQDQSKVNAYQTLLYSGVGDFIKYDYDTGDFDYSKVDKLTQAYVNGDNASISEILEEQVLSSLANELQIRFTEPDFDTYSIEKQSEIIAKALEDNNYAIQGQGSEYIKNSFDNLYAQFNKSLSTNGLDKALREYAASIEATTVAQKTYNDVMAQTILAQNEKVQESKYSDIIIEISGDNYQELYDKNYKDTLSKISDRFGSFGTESSAAAMKEYADLYNLTDDDNYRVKNFKKDGSVQYQYTENNKIKTKTVSAEDVASAVASSEVKTQLQNSAEKLATIFSNLNDSQAAIISAAAGGNASRLNLKQIQDGVKEEDLNFINNKDDLEALGYDELKDFKTDLDNTITLARENWEKQIGLLSSVSQEQVRNIANSNSEAIYSISQSVALGYGKALDLIYQTGGKDAAKNIDLAINQLMSENEEKAEEIMKAASGIDWSQGEKALNQLKGQLFDIGVYIDEDNESWKLFKQSVEKINVSIIHQDLNSIRTEISEIADIASDIELGDIIEDDDYKTLIAYNSALKEMFALTADGYMYLGDQGLGDIAVQAAAAQLQKTKDKNDAAKNAASSFAEVAQGKNEDWYGLANGTDDNSQMASMAEYLAENNQNDIAALGWDSSYIKELSLIVGDTEGAYSNEQVANAKAQLQSFYGDIITLKNNVKQELYDNTAAEEIFASTLTNLDDLNKAYRDETISLETFNRMQEVVVKNQVENEDIDYKEFEAYRDLLAKENDELKENQKALNLVAIANKKMEKGVKSLASSWDNFDKVMKDGNLEDVSEILPEVNEALEDILNLDTDEFELLPPDFAQKNWKLIKDVVDGVEGSVDALRNKAGEEILLNVGINVDSDQNGSLDTAFMELHNTIAEYDQSKFTVGIEIDPEQNAKFYTACNEIINKAGMTAEKAQAYFQSMGYDAEVEEITVPPEAHPWSIENPIYDEDASKMAGVPVFKGKKILEGVNYSGGGTALAVKTITPNGSYGGGIGVSTTTSQPKGATQSKKPQRTHQSETVERYKEVTDKIDDTTDAMEDARRAADGLWGPTRIKKMREVQNEMRKEIGLLRQEKEEAESYLAQDQAYLESVGREFGVQFAFENGNIANYTAIMNSLHAQLRNAEIAAGSNPTDSQQKALDDIQYKISEIQKAIDIYDETREKIEDINNEIEDKILELQQEKFDEINLELEVDLVVNETQLKEIEYYLSKIEDDFFGMAEAFALMVGENDRGFNQLGTYVDSLGDYQEQYNRLLSNYTTIDATTGRTLINQAQFIEGLQEVQDGLYENLGNLQDLNKEMMQYYGETLVAAAEELEKFTSLMDHHNEVLDHYSSLLELLGRAKEWKTIQNVLETQVSTAENAAKVSKANYDMLAEQAEQMKKAYDAGEVTEEQWLAAQNAANEAQNQMLEDAEVWAEALKSLLENRLEELADILNKALSGDFGSLDNMISSMERSNSLQEEYLTTTNQIYETNKLMRTAQQEIDKTTNSVAKRRLKQFIDETNQMQNQNKLSQYELEIQQAKYDLLLAEIALEEAQQAKSTVRLQRDSEGNFGYVYTADQNQVAQAQQDLEDAQNSLYNIGLEGANKYAENYAQTLQEMNDAITELTRQWQEGEITSKEEYQRKMTELEEYYNKKLLQYSELRTIALSADSRVMTDAWSQDFADMTYKTQDWMSKVSEYVKDVERVMSDYQGNMDRVEEHVGLDINSLEEKTSNLKDANTQLSGEIKDELIPSLRDEIDVVADLTKEYIKLYASIMETIGGYEDLAAAIGRTIKNESDDDSSNDLQPTNVGTSTASSTGGAGTGGKNGKIDVGDSVTYTGGTYYSSSAGDGPTGHRGVGGTVTVTDVREGSPYPIHVTSSNSAFGWLRKDQLAGYDTGGYTGNWEGSYGKLALLHKKELILNEGDTENFLAGMDILNKIISAIDLYSLNAQLGGLLSTPSYGAFGNTDTLEQNVHIEASFPNVSDHNEIEEALSTLINRASQFASRK